MIIKSIASSTHKTGETLGLLFKSSDNQWKLCVCPKKRFQPNSEAVGSCVFDLAFSLSLRRELNVGEGEPGHQSMVQKAGQYMPFFLIK